MIQNSIVVESDIAGEFIRHEVNILSLITFLRLVIVCLSASRVVLVGVDQFGEGDVSLDGSWY